MVERAKKQAFRGAEFSPLPVAFDAEQFETMTMYDAALQAEILGLFDDQLKAMLDKLALNSLNAADCKFLGHTLRGSAAAVGALEIEALAATCQEAEYIQSGFSMAFSAAVKRFILETKHYRHGS